MEDVETETTGEVPAGTAGKPPEEEKLLPPGNPAELKPKTSLEGTPNVPPVLTLPPEDLLHGGNAIAAAQEARETEERKKKEEEERSEEGWADRDLRETGLKESLPRGTNAPSKVEMPSTQEDGLPRMHTYAEDMGKEIQKRGETISSIITAEKMKAPEELEPALPAPRRKLLVALATILVLLGIGVVAVAYFMIQKSTNPAPIYETLIPVNHTTVIALNGQTPLSKLLGDARTGARLNLGEAEALVVATGTSPASAEAVLTALGAPNELARNSTGILIGLHEFDRAQPFIIVSVSAYDRAFEAMLTWEDTIGDDLGAFFAPANPAGGAAGRPPILTFVDHVSNNLDVRESQGAWPILYTFPRQNLLVITTSADTLREVLTRLSLQNASSR